MKRLVIEVASPEGRSYTFHVVGDYDPERANHLRQIMDDGGGITRVYTEIYSKPTTKTVWAKGR